VIDFQTDERSAAEPLSLSEAFSGMTRRVRVSCPDCETEFETVEVKNLRAEKDWFQTELYCEACRINHIERISEARPAHRDFHSEWKAKCPKGFLDLEFGPESDGFTNPARIPESILAEFRRYRYSNIGICAIGPSRTFKSRTMHLLLKHLFFHGYNVTLFDGIGLGAAIVDSFNSGGYGLLIERLARTQILSLDDLDKIRITERMDEAIFGIIDRRLIDGKPTFITTNLMLPDLGKYLGAQYGIPIVERIQEHCRLIETAKLLGKSWKEGHSR
jgi:DNA replication protein DnaC